MTPNDAPRTLLAAVERDLRDAAYDGAMDVALHATPAESPERARALDVADQVLEDNFTESARRLIAYLGENFHREIGPLTDRIDDDRPDSLKAQVEAEEKARREGQSR